LTIPSLLASLLDGTTPRDAQVMRFSLPPAAIRCSASRFREQNGATRRTKHVVTQSGDGRFVVDYATTHRPFAWLRGDDHVWKCCSRRRSRRCFMTSVAVAEPWRQWTCGHVPLPPPHRPIRPSNERTLERTSVRLPSVRPSVLLSVCPLLCSFEWLGCGWLGVRWQPIWGLLVSVARLSSHKTHSLTHQPRTPVFPLHSAPTIPHNSCDVPPFLTLPPSLPPSLSLTHTHTLPPSFCRHVLLCGRGGCPTGPGPGSGWARGWVGGGMGWDGWGLNGCCSLTD